jgi:hypothetical protein
MEGTCTTISGHLPPSRTGIRGLADSEVRNRALVVALGVLEELAHGVSWLLIDSAVVSLLAK